MQIHEITKLSKKRTDEGLLDSFKDAVGITPKAPDNRTIMQKLKGEAPDKIDFSKPENAKYKAQQDAYQAAQDKKTADLESYWEKKGYTVNTELDKAIATVKQSPEAEKKINGITQQFDAEFKVGIPDPGFVLVAHAKDKQGIDVKYVKDEKGIWRNENGGIIPQASAETIGLEDQVDNGSAKIEQSPASWAAKMNPPGKGKQPQVNKPVAESLIQEARKTLAQGAFEQFMASRIKGTDDAKRPITFQDVIDVPDVNTKLTQIFKKMMKANKSNPLDVPGIINGFKEYVTVAIAGIQVVKKNRATGVDASSEQEQRDQETTNPGIPTGDPFADKLSQQITPQGLDMLEKDPEKGLETLKGILNTKKRMGY